MGDAELAAHLECLLPGFAAYNVIDLMPDQKNIATKGHTMRLGNYPCKLVPGTLAHKAYQQDMVMIQERHRHRFEFNNGYKKAFEDAGMHFSGTLEHGTLCEISEIPGHPWMLGVQFHPEFKSKPLEPHPLFKDFIQTLIEGK